jgi:hypothetical protein
MYAVVRAPVKDLDHAHEVFVSWSVLFFQIQPAFPLRSSVTVSQFVSLTVHWSPGRKPLALRLWNPTTRREHRDRPANLFFAAGQVLRVSIGSGFVLKEEPLSLVIDFVAIQIVLVRPVSVVRDDAQLSA